jgi:hypothetical protein
MGVMKLDKQRCEVDVWRANGRSAFHSADGFRRHVSWSGVFADGLYRDDWMFIMRRYNKSKLITEVLCRLKKRSKQHMY